MAKQFASEGADLTLMAGRAVFQTVAPVWVWRDLWRTLAATIFALVICVTVGWGIYVAVASELEERVRYEQCLRSLSYYDATFYHQWRIEAVCED